MIELRPAQPTDTGALGAILSAHIDETPWIPRVHSRAQDLAHMGDLIDRGWVTLAEEYGHPAGFMARDEHVVHGLYLHPQSQGRGIGKTLLDHAKQTHPRLELWTFAANTRAQRFYEREGFGAHERTDGAGNDENLPDIRYVWTCPIRKDIS